MTRKGPLVVYNEDNGIAKAFRNIPGVDVAPVHSLNLLQLAPGGHMGRFLIWTEGAAAALDTVFGTHDSTSAVKKGWKIPRACVTNSDASRLVNDGAIQSIVNAPKEGTRRSKLKRNPLKNLGAMLKLNPYYSELRREAQAATARKAKRVSGGAGRERGRRGKSGAWKGWRRACSSRPAGQEAWHEPRREDGLLQGDGQGLGLPAGGVRGLRGLARQAQRQGPRCGGGGRGGAVSGPWHAWLGPGTRAWALRARGDAFAERAHDKCRDVHFR